MKLELNWTTIPIIISAIAVLISFFTLMESKAKRRREAKTNYLEEMLKQCNEALELLVFDNLSIDQDAECFNQFSSCKMVVEKNLLSLDGKQYVDYIERFKTIETDYEKLSGRRLGQRGQSLHTTIPIYQKEDFPKELDGFYKELLSLAQKKKQEILKKLKG